MNLNKGAKRVFQRCARVWLSLIIPAFFLLVVGDAWAQTNLGTVKVGSTGPIVTVTLTLSAAGTIAAPTVLTMGAPNLDFTDAGTGTCTTNGTSHVYKVGDTCTVDVKFAPKYPSVRNGAVVLTDNSSPVKLIATAYLQGKGDGPQVTFLGNSNVTELDGLFWYEEPDGSLPWHDSGGFAVDWADNLFVGDYYHGPVREYFAADPWDPKALAGGFNFGYPESVAVDGAGNVFVRDIEITAADGYTTAKSLPISGDSGCDPSGWTVDGAGNVFVADWRWNALTGCDNVGVKEFVAADSYTTVKKFGSGIGTIYPVKVDGTGNVFVGDGQGTVKEIVAAGGYTTVKTIATDMSLLFAVDSAGNVFGLSSGTVTEIVAASGYTKRFRVSPIEIPYPGIGYGAADGAGKLFVKGGDNWGGIVYRFDLTVPPALTFSDTVAPLTSSDSPKTLIVENAGTSPLTISGVDYPPDFPEASGVNTDCTSSTILEPGASCTLSISFSPLPASLSGVSELVSITTNHLNGTNVVQSVAVSGTALPLPPWLIAPASSAAPMSGLTEFQWEPGGQSSQFQLRIGSYPGWSDIYDSGVLPNAVTSRTATIPPNGATFFVRLHYLMNGKWGYVDYRFKESGTATPPALTGPFSSSPISGSTTFTWTPGVGSTRFMLRIGGYPGSTTIYDSGSLANTVTTKTATIPSNGVNFYVRLSYLMNGTWSYIDYTFMETGKSVAPALTSPLPSLSPRMGSTTFTWSSGAGSAAFMLRIGGYPGFSNIYDSGVLANTVTRRTVYIPSNGVNFYVRLSYLMNGTWSNLDYTFKEAGKSSLPALTGPSSSWPQTGRTMFFWNPGVGSAAFMFRVGSYPGWTNIYDSGVLANSVTTKNATIPSNGVNFYVRLYYLMNGTWSYLDYTFKENGTAYPPVLTGPSAASPLSGATTFTWTPGVGASAFELRVLTAEPNFSHLDDSGMLPITVTSRTVTIPRNGQTLYVRLLYLANGSWHFQDYIYHEAS